MWRSLVAWVLIVALGWAAYLDVADLAGWQYSPSHFACARLGVGALYFVGAGLEVALLVAAMAALLFPRARGFGLVVGALLYGLAHTLVTVRLVGADLEGARRVFAQGGVEAGHMLTAEELDAMFSPAGQQQRAGTALVFSLACGVLLMTIRPYFEPRA